MEAVTLRIKNAAGEEVLINKPKKKALAELALAVEEERVPNLTEQDREDAQNFIDWSARGYKEAKPEAAAEEKATKPKKGPKAAEPESSSTEEGK
jgi:hypothetical protein